MDIIRQFYDRRLWYVWGALLAAHLLAAAIQHTWWSVLPLLAAGIAAFILTLYRLEWGMAFAFLEIFIGGHGHLFALGAVGIPLSLRMTIFGGVMAAWAVLLVRKQVLATFIPRRDTPWVLLGLALLVGTIKGFATNDPSKAFDDMNSYLAALYFLPMISIVWTPEKKRLLMLTLFAGAVWVAVNTLVFLFAFTHLPGTFLRELYQFVRDARLAEVTLLSVRDSLVAFFPTGDWYFRIFEQGQFVVVAFELVFLAATFMLYREKDDRLPKAAWALHAGMIAVILASLSRSFWLGLIAGGLALFVAFALDRVPVLVMARRSISLGISAAIAVIVLWLLIVIPVPPRPDFTTSPFYRGNDSDDRALAVTSRWNLLPPMIKEIQSSPIIGSGFGEEVTFVSDDPRIRAQNPSGEWSTYRFEWGYQDLWLKTGIFGLVAVFWYLMGILNAVILRLRLADESRWMSVGFGAAVLALFVIHVFSPYLNHPIGLGFMVFALPFFPWREERYEREETHVLDKAKDAFSSITKPQVGVVTRFPS